MTSFWTSIRRFLSVLTLVAMTAGPADAATTFWVLNNADAGLFTLRKAITDANASPGLDTIAFGLPPAQLTIKPMTALPPITQPVKIDGGTQTGWSGTPLVELDGSLAGAGAAGLSVYGGGTTIRGLVINRFSAAGIALADGDGNVVQSCWIGSDVTGVIARPNAAGIVINSDSIGNLIGGATAASRNVVSGNTANGLALTYGADQTVVMNNYIGTTAAGDAPLPNGGDGIRVITDDNLIGAGAVGNLISGNGGSGISVDTGTSGNSIVANVVGLQVNGTSALPNHGSGITFFGDSGYIGLPAAGSGNVVSGNTFNGIYVGGTNVTVSGNRVGTNAVGTVAIGNGGVGIYVDGEDGHIGGNVPGAGNLVSGNGNAGINIDGTANAVEGNVVGLTLAGTAKLANAGGGISVHGLGNTIGGVASGSGNVVSGNAYYGIFVDDGGHVIQGNRIGTDPTGTVALGNEGTGLRVDGDDNHVGGSVLGAGNLASGNGGDGVSVAGTRNVVEGNIVGLTLAGTTKLANAGGGVVVHGQGNRVGGTNPGSRNVVSGNTYAGFVVEGLDHVIQGNRIGTNAAGTAAVPNTIGIRLYEAVDATIGGAAPGAGNLVSGNLVSAIDVGNHSTGVSILGNVVGLSASGTANIPNEGGIRLYGSGNVVGAPGAGNVIAGNMFSGLVLYGASDEPVTGNVIQANLIGVGPDGTTPHPNTQVGVFLVAAWDNVVGGDGPGEGNVIAHNGQYGVFVDSGDGNTITGNSIFENGYAGVDLAPYGVTENDAGDADLGPNHTQNFPVVSAVDVGTSSTELSGVLDAAPGETHQIELFSSPTCDPSGLGEGRVFLGRTTAVTDATGHATFDVTLPGAAAGPYVTATATSGSGDTSEFSPCALTDGPNPGAFQFSQTQYVGYEFEPDGVVRVTVTRSLGVVGNVSVHYATSSVQATPGVDYTETSGTLAFGPGEVVKHFDVPVTYDALTEGNEDIVLTLSAPTGGTVLGTQATSKIVLIDYSPTLPTAFVSDATVVEGDAGTADMQFTITLSPNSSPVTIHWQTEGGSATPGVDFTPKSGQLLFSPGAGPKTVTVPIIGDGVVEADESMFVRITAVYAGTVTDGMGEGRIEDDDALPPLCTGGTSISNARVLVKKLGGNLGDESVALSGRLLFPAGQPSGMTPLASDARGAQILVEDLGTPGTPLIDLTHWTAPVPAGPQTDVCTPGKLDGWRANGASTSYTYQNRSARLPGAGCTTGSAKGLKKLTLKDKRAGSSRIDAKATFGNASIPSIVGPLRITMVLGADAASGAAGACGSATFAPGRCGFNASGTMFICQ